MRKFFLTCTAAVIGLTIASFASPWAQAVPIAAPASLSGALHEANLIQRASHVCRGGRHWRRCYGGYFDYTPHYSYNFYRPEPYYAYGYYQLRHYPAWFWGWRQPWWW